MNPNKKRHQVYMDATLHKRGRLQAVEEDMSFKDLIVKSLEEYLDRAEKKKEGKNNDLE